MLPGRTVLVSLPFPLSERVPLVVATPAMHAAATSAAMPEVITIRRERRLRGAAEDEPGAPDEPTAGSGAVHG